MTISNSGSDERGKSFGGAAGDQTGGEWRIRSWYNGGWDVVLRHPNERVRETIAMNAEDAANNNRIGYDQGQRTTFYQKLKAANWRAKDIKAKCEADCSAGVTACAIAAGYLCGYSKLKKLNYTTYTGNMRSRFISAGFTALTASKYLTSDKHLLRGDILLNDKGGHHTCINLTNGSAVSGATATTNTNGASKVTIKLYILENGAKGAEVKALQILLIGLGYPCGKAGADGIFGADTAAAVKKYQKAKKLEVDGIVGKDTWSSLLGA